MEDLILISQLNDFIFCPVSIYFHNLYADQEKMLYQEKRQIDGTHAHKTIDGGNYSGSKDAVTSLDVYCEKYSLVGKIDIYYQNTKCLVERKRKIAKIYDGYIFQLYGQYFAMKEMGYDVQKLQLYSMVDNKKYEVALPEQDEIMYQKFEELICDIKNFSMEYFIQDNQKKCKNCIYEPACDSTLKEDDYAQCTGF